MGIKTQFLSGYLVIVLLSGCGGAASVTGAIEPPVVYGPAPPIASQNPKSSSQVQPYLVRQKPPYPSSGPAGAIRGRLVNDHGCLRVIPEWQDPSPGYLILWPPGTTLVDASSNLHIRIPVPRLSGQTITYTDKIAKINESIFVGGGGYDDRESLRRWLENQFAEEPFPATCAGPYWLAMFTIHD